MANAVVGVMRDCHNFFEDGYIDGRFEVSAGGKLTPNNAFVSGQYIAITGSSFHNGVYRLIGGFLFDSMSMDVDDDADTVEYLPAEAFSGRIWSLNPPADFIAICKSVNDFKCATPVTGLQSESFGEYSYSRATGKNGALTWQEAYADSLRPYRRMFTEVDC